MAIWRFIKVLIVTIIIFAVFNFLLSNFNAHTLGAKISFHFNIPPFLYLESVDFPIGFLLVSAFCLGMLTAAMMGTLSVFYKNKEIKAKKRIIRELEAEMDDLRAHLNREHYVYSGKKEEKTDQFSDNPSLD